MAVELPPSPSTALMGHHHITMGVGDPQEDFDSIYVRMPSGALFEACASHDPSFLMDEPAETLGTQVMMSPQIKANEEEVFAIIGRVEG